MLEGTRGMQKNVLFQNAADGRFSPWASTGTRPTVASWSKRYRNKFVLRLLIESHFGIEQCLHSEKLCCRPLAASGRHP